MHGSIAVFFDFNYGACIVAVGKGLGNRDGRGISESQVNDMIQCLAQIFAGDMVSDELVEHLGRGVGLMAGGVAMHFSSGSIIGNEWGCCLVLVGC